MNPSKSDKTNGLIDFFFGSTGHLWAVLTEALSFGLTAMVYAFKESELLVLRVDVSRYYSDGEIFLLVIAETLLVSLLTLVLLSLVRATIRGYTRDRRDGKFQ
jgi:hypothetical protein